MTDMDRRQPHLLGRRVWYPAETRTPPLLGGVHIGLAPVRSDSGTHLVEAAAAVDGPIVARQERHECLTSAFRTYRGVHLTLSVAPACRNPQRSILLGDGTAALAPLRLVHEPLLG